LYKPKQKLLFDAETFYTLSFAEINTCVGGKETASSGEPSERHIIAPSLYIARFIRPISAEVLAVTLNPEGGTPEQLAEFQKKMEEKLEIPFVRPVENGCERLLPAIRRYVENAVDGPVD
jgi:hypothetical protein